MALRNVLGDKGILGNPQFGIAELVSVDEGEDQEEDGGKLIVDGLKFTCGA